MRKSVLLAGVSCLTVCTLLSANTAYAGDDRTNSLLGSLTGSSHGQNTNSSNGNFISNTIASTLSPINQIVTQFTQSISNLQSTLPQSSSSSSIANAGVTNHADSGATAPSSTHVNVSAGVSPSRTSPNSVTLAGGTSATKSNPTNVQDTSDKWSGETAIHQVAPSHFVASKVKSSQQPATAVNGLNAALDTYHQSTIDDSNAQTVLLSSVKSYESALEQASAASDDDLFIKHQQDAANALKLLQDALEKQDQNNQLINQLRTVSNQNNAAQMQSILVKMANLERQKATSLADAATLLSNASTDIQANL